MKHKLKLKNGTEIIFQRKLNEIWSKGEAELLEGPQNLINRLVKEKMTLRAKWIDDQFKRLIPKWQQKIMLKNYGLFIFKKLFGWQIEYKRYDLTSRTKISIYHHNKFIISKIFKDSL